MSHSGTTIKNRCKGNLQWQSKKHHMLQKLLRRVTFAATPKSLLGIFIGRGLSMKAIIQSHGVSTWCDPGSHLNKLFVSIKLPSSFSFRIFLANTHKRTVVNQLLTGKLEAKKISIYTDQPRH